MNSRRSGHSPHTFLEALILLVFCLTLWGLSTGLALANTIPTDAFGCNSQEMTLTTTVAPDGRSLVVEEARGLTPAPWDSRIRLDVEPQGGFGGIFWLGAGAASLDDRFLIDIVVCPRPGVAGPPLNCPRAFYEVRAFREDPEGFLWRLEPWAAPWVNIFAQSGGGEITMPLCGIPQYGTSVVQP